ncbi:uncharacterized protein si:ch211-227n13.3 [Syngnathus typhle]|uniref:uncharacterized protein si:ch211-227n13.3 n=1 Tax=Syngnathus typhle TaxID=161592 RepID=UPI002A6B171E|nr:uncharacterized protein si:ch211-227n13.3 [Syngnathus typhle]
MSKTPTQSTSDGTEYQSDCFESYSKSRQVKWLFQSSSVCNLSWRVRMSNKHSSRLKTASKKKFDKSPKLSEHVVQRRIQPKRRRRNMEFDDSNIHKKDDSVCDIIDLINSHIEEEPKKDSSVKVVFDQGLHDSDSQCCSSTAPSPQKVMTPRQTRSPTGLCPSCQKLYQRAKTLKTPIKDKLLDNNPTSLICDQWFLVKKWKPRRLPHSGRISHSVLRVHTQLKGKKKAKQNNQDGHKNFCSRQHVFLQRNLRRPHQVAERKQRKRNLRKRQRDDSQGSRMAKQKYLPPPDNSSKCNNKSAFQLSCLNVEGFHSEESTNEDNSSVTSNVSCTNFTLESTKLGDIMPKPTASRTKSSFQHLLTQLRGNSSMIFKDN